MEAVYIDELVLNTELYCKVESIKWTRKETHEVM